jgi:hypothetical protein
MRAFGIAVAVSLGGCDKTDDIHDTKEARSQPCIGCHLSAYVAVASPKHLGEFPTTCETCHETSAWRPAALPDHHWFVLDGKHAEATCGQCHLGDPPRYAGTPRDCAGCHRDAYERTQNPAHVNLLPDTCGDCHSKEAWVPARVTEHPWFTLDGAHATTPCANCHQGDPKQFVGLPTECVGCHLADYQRSTFPGHNQFPQTCHDCHDTKAW